MMQGSCFANDYLIFTFRSCLYPLKFSTRSLLWELIEDPTELYLKWGTFFSITQV